MNITREQAIILFLKGFELSQWLKACKETGFDISQLEELPRQIDIIKSLGVTQQEIDDATT